MVKLKYRVENSAIAPRTRTVSVDGVTGQMVSDRLSVELVPVEHNGGTLSLELDPATKGFDEGAAFLVTLSPVSGGDK